MPTTSSAKKALRQSARQRAHNLRRQRAIADLSKQIRKLVAAGNRTGATALLSRAYKAIDKAAKTHVLKQNTAARKKSRLARLLVS